MNVMVVVVVLAVAVALLVVVTTRSGAMLNTTPAYLSGKSHALFSATVAPIFDMNLLAPIVTPMHAIASALSRRPHATGLYAAKW